MSKIASYMLATVFGVGYFPFASGTAGSAATLPFAFAAAYFGGFWAVLALSAIVYIAGTFATAEVLKYTGPDPSIIVIDEVVGQLVTLLLVAGSLRGNLEDWWIYVAAFLLFRLFDIVKPWPAGYIDRTMLNAHGVMLDDLFAGIYAAVALWVLKWFF
jgi:phosphatidylglycerophosphatase A